MVKNLLPNAGDSGSILGMGGSPGEGYGNPLQYFCLENHMDRGAWWATVQRVLKSQTQLKQLSMHACAYIIITSHSKSESESCSVVSDSL